MTKHLEIIVSDGQSQFKPRLTQVAQLLASIPNGYEAAVSRAMNRAAVAGRAAAVQTIREEYTLKSGTIRRHFGIERASRSSLEALVYARGSMLPLHHYKVLPRSGDTTGNARRRVRVNVRRREPAKGLPATFIHKGRVLRRLGTRSLPVKEAYGPAVPLLAGNTEIAENITSVMQETFVERLNHETTQILKLGSVQSRRKG